MKSHRILLITTLTLLIATSLCELQAQSGHYWTNQYGTRSMLLSGSVIGGVEDLGAVFYNPARLSQTDNPAFLISADVYEWQRLSIENAVGQSADAKRSSFGGVPSMAAGTFNLGFLPNHQFAYAVLLRQKGGLNFGYREEFSGDIIESFPGEEVFEGQISINSSTKDEWFGLSWSHALNDVISLGASGFLSINNTSNSTDIRLRALSEAGSVAIYDFNRNIGYETFGLIYKLGAAFQFDNSSWGITLTTPRINLKGDGNYRYQLYFSGIEGQTAEDTYGNSYQSGIKLKYKSPWALGLGSSFKIGANQMHISAEYFTGIPQYRMMQVAGHAIQSNPDTVINYSLVESARGVLNAGIGFEWFLNEKISAYTSFSTDFSSVRNDAVGFVQLEQTSNNSTIRVDYYNMGGGIVLTLKGADITLGATYLGAKQNFNRPVDMPEEGDDGIFDQDETGTLKWRRWRFVFSFSVPFFKDYAKKLEDKYLKKDSN
jgi:hypothetical protein